VIFGVGAFANIGNRAADEMPRACTLSDKRSRTSARRHRMSLGPGLEAPSALLARTAGVPPEMGPQWAQEIIRLA